MHVTATDSKLMSPPLLCVNFVKFSRYKHLVCVEDMARSYADDLDRIEREYKQRMKKYEAAFARRYNDISSQLKSQQVLCS